MYWRALAQPRVCVCAYVCINTREHRLYVFMSVVSSVSLSVRRGECLCVCVCTRTMSSSSLSYLPHQQQQQHTNARAPLTPSMYVCVCVSLPLPLPLPLLFSLPRSWRAYWARGACRLPVAVVVVAFACFPLHILLSLPVLCVVVILKIVFICCCCCYCCLC